MSDAFSRRSVIETSNYNNEDLGFLFKMPGEEQVNVHNRSVTVIVVALLYQSLDNYFIIKRLKPNLKYVILDDFLGDLESQFSFLDGMRTIRNGVFHIRDPKSWRSRSVDSFHEGCMNRGGVLATMTELLNLLYGFTEKVFGGELRIWPESVYEQIENLDKARPDLKTKLENGKISFAEYVEAILFSERKNE